MRAAPVSEGQSCERRDPVHQELAEGQLSQAADADTAVHTWLSGVDETGDRGAAPLLSGHSWGRDDAHRRGEKKTLRGSAVDQVG